MDSIEGISLAQINAKKMHIHTRSSFSAQLLGGKAEKNDVCMPIEWAEQVEAWNEALEVMATGFLGGVGWVSSFDKALPLGYEHLEPLL